jgi:hypothetical protein
MAARRRLPLASGFAAFWVVLVAVAVVAGSAWAHASHPLIGSFGLNGGSGFPSAASLAVDESTGDVYVFDAENEAIYKFTADGVPAEFSSLKTNVISKVGGQGEFPNTQLAVDNSSSPAKGDIYFANRFHLYIFRSNGESLGELTGVGYPHTQYMCGVTVGASGDVYVSGHELVSRYVPTGNPVTNNDYADTLITRQEQACNIAVDPHGDLYASGRNLLKYGAVEFNTVGQEAFGSVFVPQQSYSPAVDPVNEDVYVATASSVNQYDATGAPVTEIGGLSLPLAVGLNGQSGRVYVPEPFGGPVRIYGPLVIAADVTGVAATEVQPTSVTLDAVVNPSGAPVTECVFEYGEMNGIEIAQKVEKFTKNVPCSPQPGSGTSNVAVSASVIGLQESTSYGFRIKVANAEQGNASEPLTFETLGPPTAGIDEYPYVVNGKKFVYGAGNITQTEATVTGSVNPHGFSTTYHIEYGKTTSYGTSIPVPDGEVGSSTTNVPVSVGLTGLEPGTTYHVRIRAVNTRGESFSPDATFPTQPPAEIRNESTLNVRSTTGTLRAEINPLRTDTSYRFEYGPTASYGMNVPVPDGRVGAAYGEQFVSVSEQVGNLQASTTYHFRVVASNVYGTVPGPDHTFTTFEAPTSVVGADTCPNAVYRVRFSTALPDCRAFEMVSPVEKSGADVIATAPDNIAIASSGGRVDFMTRTGMGETHGSGEAGFSQFLATRGANGWSSHGVYPTPALNEPIQGLSRGTEFSIYSEELDKAVTEAYSLPGVAGAVPNSNNLYIENMLTVGMVEPVTKLEVPEAEGSQLVWSLGASSDLSVAAFETPSDLVPRAVGKEQKFYESRNGKVELVGYLPDGSLPPAGAAAPRAGVTGGESLLRKDTVSSDGSRILFVSPPTGPESQLYMRRNGTSTAWVSEPETSGPSFVPHNIHFETSTSDGKHVLFTSPEPLLSVDSGGGGIGLYMYTEGSSPQSGSNLTFIGRSNPSIGPGPRVVGVSGDGSHVYFMGDSGLALWDKGQVHVIGTSVGTAHFEQSVVSPDGRQLLFMDPVDPEQITSREIGEGFNSSKKTEIYLYDEASETVSCVSCPPSGATPISGVELYPRGTGPTNPEPKLPIVQRFVSWSGGFVFFNTSESLVPQDTNGVADAYEYNMRTGKLSLLSLGSGENGTWFMQSNPSGSDVLLATREQLTGWDEDKLDDVYDARVNGGYPEPPHPRTPCEGDACQGVPAAVPSFSTASGFTGLGNIPPEPASSSKSKTLTGAERLKRALKLCAKKPKRKRSSCRAQARKRYASKSSVKRASRRAGR